MPLNVNSKLPSATQSLTPLGKIQRRAQCPDHEKWSSNYQGADVHGWLFRCLDMKVTHLFYAKPDKSAPTTEAEIPAWVRRQNMQKLAKMKSKEQ